MSRINELGIVVPVLPGTVIHTTASGTDAINVESKGSGQLQVKCSGTGRLLMSAAEGGALMTALGTATINSSSGVVLSSTSGGIRLSSISGFLADLTQISQSTSSTTAVNMNYPLGRIRTVSLTLLPGQDTSFNVNLFQLQATGIVLLNGVSYAGTGFPIVTVSAVNSGSFTVRIVNVHTTDSLNDTVTFGYMIVNPTA